MLVGACPIRGYIVAVGDLVAGLNGALVRMSSGPFTPPLSISNVSSSDSPARFTVNVLDL